MKKSFFIGAVLSVMLWNQAFSGEQVNITDGGTTYNYRVVHPSSECFSDPIDRASAWCVHYASNLGHNTANFTGNIWVAMLKGDGTATQSVELSPGGYTVFPANGDYGALLQALGSDNQNQQGGQNFMVVDGHAGRVEADTVLTDVCYPSHSQAVNDIPYFHIVLQPRPQS